MGIILGALAGAGQAVSEIADANQKRWDQAAIDERRNALEIQKAKTLAEFGAAQDQSKSARQWKEEQERAPIKREMAAADERARLKVKLDPEIQQLQIDAKTRELTAGEQAKLDFALKNQDSIDKLTKGQANAKESDVDVAYKEAQAKRAVRSGAVYGEERQNISSSLSSLDREMDNLQRMQANWLREKPSLAADDKEIAAWQKRIDKLDADMAGVQALRRQKQAALEKLIDMDGPLEEPKPDAKKPIIGSAVRMPTGTIPKKDDVKKRFLELNK